MRNRTPAWNLSTMHSRPRTLTHALLIRRYHIIASKILSRPRPAGVTWNSHDWQTLAVLFPARAKALDRICRLRSKLS